MSLNFINLHNPSALGAQFTQPLTEMSSRDKYFWGVERGRCVKLTVSLPSVSQLFRQYGVINISTP
jgi:hypothetical protein